MGEPVLKENHRQEFHASGISDEMIAAAGVYSVQNSSVRNILGWQPSHTNWGEGWAIPFRFPDEPTPTYQRVKLEFPRHADDGEVIKYESPRGKPNRPYLAPGFWTAWERGDRLVITEGEKKALKAMQEGFLCIGLVGVWGFQNKRLRDDQGKKYGKTELVPDLEKLNWAGRQVYIVYDSDCAAKEGVRLAEAKLAEVLTRKGALVRIVRLPPGPDGEKVGIDDYLVTHDVAAFEALMDKAVEASPPAPLEAIDWARWIKARNSSAMALPLCGRLPSVLNRNHGIASPDAILLPTSLQATRRISAGLDCSCRSSLASSSARSGRFSFAAA